MNRLLLYVNYRKDSKLEKTYEIADTLDSLGYNVYIMLNTDAVQIKREKYEIIKTDDEMIENRIELVICIGGDGNILGYIRNHSHSKIPIVGLNLGTLGFLTELSLENYERVFRELREGKETYRIEERVGIYIDYQDEEESKRFFAVNDLAVTRGNRARIIKTEIYINGIYVDMYEGDGILISTPTGSTGYNLSVGGPILLPTSTNLIISPICPHSLRSRPIVITKDDIVTVKLVSVALDMNDVSSITIDGQVSYDIKTNSYLNVKARSEKVKILVFDEEIFFRKLREKIR